MRLLRELYSGTQRHLYEMQHLRFHFRVQLKGSAMATKLVDVFDRTGAKLFTYSIVFEEQECLDAEFEEAALICAEFSGMIEQQEIVHLRAACALTPLELEMHDAAISPNQAKPRKGALVSLVKHRMKRAKERAPSSRIRQVS